MILASVTHYPDTNTLEAAWNDPILDSTGATIGVQRIKCVSYDSTQKVQFETDVGTGATKYTTLAGW